ncbi:MAG TPA: caspase family protein, partial [Woeseiaceae bacterium]|nr:caspase family protein [Woeseiaceae bacterium]
MRFSRLLTIPLAYVALTTAVWAQDKAAGVGLVIGNTTYAAADPALSAVSTDARQLAEEFRKNNFDIDLKENLNLSEMRRAIDTFVGKIREGSAAVLYFGGYGVQIGGKTYLIPVDSQISSEEAARVDGISVDTTVAEMHRRGAKVKIVIIDAARRNPYETKFRRDAAGLATLSAPEGMLAIYSAAPGKVVPLQPGAPSLFMRELLKQVQVPKRSFEDVLNNVRNIVSRGTNYEQSPWVSISLYDQFYIVQEQPAKTATTTAPAAKVATTTTAPATTTTTTPAGTSPPTATTPAAKAAPAAKVATTTTAPAT